MIIYKKFSGSKWNFTELSQNLHVYAVVWGCEQNSTVLNESKWKFSFLIGIFHLAMLTLQMSIKTWVNFIHEMKLISEQNHSIELKQN